MKKSIAIIGSGASALMLAAKLDESKFDITLYERKIAPARKFLVAGDGGFNLTHSEEIKSFINRYTPSTFLEKSILNFTNSDLRNWLNEIGIATFVGSSGRVFPTEGIKPIDVLNAILVVLKNKNVTIKTQHEWMGWNDKNELRFKTATNELAVTDYITVFALGGASWNITGSDGSWANLFLQKGIYMIPFQPSNCACKINWSEDFIAKEEGQPLKNIAITCGNEIKKGEAIITKFGIEGGVVYALSPHIRKQLNEKNEATILVDLKPILTTDEIGNKLTNRGNKSITTILKNEFHLGETVIHLLKTNLSKEEFIEPKQLAEKIKKLPLSIVGLSPINEAISTVGGVALHEVDDFFQLKKLPSNYAIGEMLDWDAPTGGYLLQACFSMGNYLAAKLNQEK